MSRSFTKFFAVAMLIISAGVMMTVSFDAEARRMGGGGSFGRQSSNISKQTKPATPPAAASATQRSAAPAAGAATAGAAGTAAKSGMSRFLGPIAGIAAGLGIAALLSHLGMGGAFLEMLSSMVLIGLVIFAVLFIVRRMRGASANKPAMQGAHGAGGIFKQSEPAPQPQTGWQQPAAAASAASAVEDVAPIQAAPVDEKWFIPADFDTPAFLATAKAQFVAIQAVWDSGDLNKLADYLTDDLIAEFKPQILAREGKPESTEIVLLNAELMGIEAVAGGHLASVRYSGMLRESSQSEAFRFEEVWNLYKAENAGWLLAGIQQIPVENAS